MYTYTVEPRAVDPHCFDADPDPDPAQNFDTDPDPDPGGGGEGVGQPKMCIPPGKILGTPLAVSQNEFEMCKLTLHKKAKYCSEKGKTNIRFFYYFHHFS